MVTLSSLRTFVAVAETGGIQKAAERLGRTPSAVSMALQQFEAQIGAKLFVGDRKDKLSKVGAFSELQSREVLSHHERAVSSMQAFARNTVGRIDIACVPSVVASILPSIVHRIRAISPESEINIRDTDSVSVIRLVEQGEYGIGICSPVLSRPELSFSPLFSEPLGIVCRSGDPLEKLKAPLSWNAIKDRLLLENGLSFIIKHPQYRELVAKTSIKITSHTAVLAMVRAGVAITVLSRLSVSLPGSDLRFLPVADSDASRTVGIFTRSQESLSPAEVQFISLLKSAVVSEQKKLGLTAHADLTNAA